VVIGPASSGRILALLVEIKNTGGKLTEDEADFFAKLPKGAPAIVAYDAGTVLAWFGQN
jgi:hypothetical protein